MVKNSTLFVVSQTIQVYFIFLLQGKKFVGVSCATDHAQLYLLSTQKNPSNNLLFYYCSCYGHHGANHVSAAIECVMHYWECPLTT